MSRFRATAYALSVFNVPQNMHRTVTIVQRRLTHYRVPLFDRLKQLLADEDVQLRLLVGQPTAAEQAKDDEGLLPWAERLPTRYLLGGKICWMPFLGTARGSDLIVVTQENKLVHNLLAFARPGRRYAIAFWGHGRNLQAQQPDGALERFKRWTTSRADWWFPYTALSAKFVEEAGFPAARMTVLDNSIDTSALEAAVLVARTQSEAALRLKYSLPASGPVGIFLGSLYAERRIDWLLQAAYQIRACHPDFNLVIAGNGPHRHIAEEAAKSADWIRYVGTVRDERKAELLALSSLMLNPGVIGLGVLDAFASGLPIVTCDIRGHGPEVAYLRTGHNGVVTSDSLPAYVDAVTLLLSDHSVLARLQAGAASSCANYGIEPMAGRFRDGILSCLAKR